MHTYISLVLKPNINTHSPDSDIGYYFQIMGNTSERKAPAA
jgi:hypothetical protein